MRRYLQQTPVWTVLLLLASCAAQQKPPPTVGDEESFDGLRRVENSRVARAWVLPGIDLSVYKKVRLEGAGIAYLPVPNSGRNARQFEVSAADQQKLKEIFATAFTQELQKSQRFELVSEPGPDVLTVWGGLIDVVSYVPPERAGRDRIYIGEIGAATLVIELRDSESHATLVRAADRRTAGMPGNMMQRSSGPASWAQVQRVARSWATLLRERLDAVDSWQIPAS